MVEPDAALGRDELIEFLRERRIGTGVHYRAVHLHPYYRDRYGIHPGALPVATEMSARTLSLPLGPSLQERDQRYVAEALRDGIDARRPALSFPAARAIAGS